MNDEGEKLNPESTDESTSIDTTAGESAAPSKQPEQAVDNQQLDSGSPVATKADEMTEEPDVLETPASDDTVTEDEGGATESEASEQVAEAHENEAEDDEEPEPVVPAGPVEIDVPEEEEIHLDWYILKVQSNRERSIAEALRRKIAIESLDHLFGQVLVPTEKVTEFKGGKKKIVERKLWPGYIAVEMHVNDDTWFAIRETSGIGDFTGSAGKPTPMEPSEVALILHTEEEETEEAPKLDIKFSPGDKVKVMEGNFENFEGEVSSIDETHGRVTVMLSIFGRPTPVELEYWQVEGV